MTKLNCHNCHNCHTVTTGMSEDAVLRFPLPDLSHHARHHAQLVGCCPAELLFRNYHQRWEMGSHP